MSKCPFCRDLPIITPVYVLTVYPDGTSTDETFDSNICPECRKWRHTRTPGGYERAKRRGRAAIRRDINEYYKSIKNKGGNLGY